MLPQRPRASLAVAPDSVVSPSNTTTNGDDFPACLSCRRRKLRCSRERPSCTQCMRLSCECVYDQRRQKPGLKAGAIESINQRLDLLEQRLENINTSSSDRDSTRNWPSANSIDVHGCVYHASLLLANHLKVATQGDTSDDIYDSQPSRLPLDQSLNCSRPLTSSNLEYPHLAHDEHFPTKKRRLDTSGGWRRAYDASTPADVLPPPSVIDAVITKYFDTIHHWLPMVHERRLRARLADEQDSKNLSILIHAMIAATLRHVDHSEVDVDRGDISAQVRLSTNVVMLNAMDKLSVENAQALIILAFERMGSGEWSKAWSIIGSLTRTVDYLQMTTEPDESRARPLLSPLTLLPRPKTYAEKEERKRVFWNIFLLDRLCSLVCGWSTGFTSDNVSRQLPCNGAIWRNGEEAVTPYFGLWEKSQGKIGNSVAFLPTHRASPNDSGQLNASPGTQQGIDISNLGAVAYRIEAAESLSQVSSFFLQQHVNFRDRQEIKSWLTRFKELDLRLVHWKLFLPQRWKESKVARDAIVKMDPNLTLAHVTHNTSMILLHQHIAYPSQTLSRAVNLPSSCSAETCELAAVETAAIAWKYLRQSPHIMLNPEFVFCAFVAAKVLLVHCHYNNTELAAEFSHLVEGLEEMSRRWRAVDRDSAEQNDNDPSNLDLAGSYALQLREYHKKCQENPAFAMEILQHSAASALSRSGKDMGAAESPEYSHHDANGLGISANPSPSDPGSWNSPAVARSDMSAAATPMHHMPRSSSMLPPPTPSPSFTSRVPAIGQGSFIQQAPTSVNGFYENPVTASARTSTASPDGPDNLLAMSDSLMGQGFTQLDRVITFDGTPFSFDPFQFADFSFNAYDVPTNP